MANLDKLISAGLVTATHHLPKEAVEALEKLTDQEVATLVSVKQKLGDDFLKNYVTAHHADCFI